MVRKIAIFVVLGAILAGCAGQEGDKSATGPQSSDSPRSASDQAIVSNQVVGGMRRNSSEFRGAANETEQPRAQIRGASLAMRVEKLEEAEKKVDDAVKENGGFVQNLTSSDLSGPDASLSIVAKVPVEKVDDTIAKIEGLGTRLTKTVSMQDVTNQIAYDDLKLKARKDQLDFLLHKKSLTESEKERLNELTVEKNSIEAEREAKAREASFATLTLTLRQGAVTGSNQDPNWLAQSYGQSSSAAIAVFRVVATVFLWIVFMSPFYLPFVVLGWLVYRTYRRKSNTRPAGPPISA
jgi:hypothetical protein